MKFRKFATAVGSALAMLVLILDGKTAILGAQEGISLCIRSLIPSLFPFFVIGQTLTGALMGSQIPLLQPISRLLQMPEGSESLFITGFLGGYPVGAQTIAYAWREGQLDRKDAQRLLAFCNNVGPSFLFGVLGPVLMDEKAVWILWAVHIISALLVAHLIPGQPGKCNLLYRTVTLPQAVKQALQTMASVCGWVILFRICIAFLQRWFLWRYSPTWRVAIMGILELANGCCNLNTIPKDMALILAAGLLGFGGICVTMQTVSVTEGLQLKCYFLGKLIQSIFSMIFTWSILTGNYFPGIVILMFCVAVRFLRKSKKGVEIQNVLVYNADIYEQGGRTYAVPEKDSAIL